MTYTDELAREMLLEKASQLDSSSPRPQATPSPSPVPPPSKPSEAQAATSSATPPATEAPAPKKDASNRTMRISEESMDGFMEQVGELMGLAEQFRYM